MGGLRSRPPGEMRTMWCTGVDDPTSSGAAGWSHGRGPPVAGLGRGEGAAQATLATRKRVTEWGRSGPRVVRVAHTAGGATWPAPGSRRTGRMVRRVAAISSPQVPAPPADGRDAATLEDRRQLGGSPLRIHEPPRPTVLVLEQPGQLPKDSRVDVSEEPGRVSANCTGQRAGDAPGPLRRPGHASTSRSVASTSWSA